MMPNYRKGLLFAHFAALLFGMTGILGALIKTDAALITFGRAAFAFISLFIVAKFLRLHLKANLTRSLFVKLAFSGALLAIHWVTFFYAIKIGGVAMATLALPASLPLLRLLSDLSLRIMSTLLHGF
ncbi:hypothetical protein [Pelistega indica]|uniref:hypothetical protein n=1 Tax=Pelistega indica TaxID=1414851 RepID=UPI000401541E|nr:hypothetical protein [Pelistega indica]